MQNNLPNCFGFSSFLKWLMDIFGLTKPTKTNHETKQTNPLAEEKMLRRDLSKTKKIS